MFDRFRRVSRRGSVAAALVTCALVLTACGDQDEHHRQSALRAKGPDARKILDLTRPFFWIAVAVGVGVITATVTVALKFREKPGQPRNPKQVHGNAPLEITWTIVPALILLVMGVFTVSTIFDLSKKPTGANVVHVNVTGKQWWWEYEYTDKDTNFITANEMHIPVDTPVFLTMTGDDVIHSFWIPELAGKKDTVPGRTSYLTIEGDTVGEYRGQCAEFCGLSHARMGLKVFVDSRADYDNWVASQRAKASSALNEFVNDPSGPIQQFGCQSCHTLLDTDKAVRGPNLTHLGDRTSFAGDTYDLTLDNLTKWVHNAPSMKPMEQGPDPKLPRKGMPNFSDPAWGMTLDQARDIAKNLLCATATDPGRHPEWGC
jgi:cytochrome c oxidase subunit II